MKYLKYLLQKSCRLMIAPCMVIVSSCAGVLDSAPDGKISLDEVFLDNDQVSAYLNSAYEFIPSGGVRWFFVMRGPVVWCDEAWDADADSDPGICSGRVYSGQASASNHPIINPALLQEGNGDYWNRFWQGIRKSTVFLTHIDEATVNSGTNRSRWKAEAHLLRAFYYSELLRWFGCALPIVREAYTLDYNFSEVTRSSYYEVVQFIIEDCDAALRSPDLPWRITTDAEGFRFTKALAEGIKSRMSLYAASPLYNEGQNYWEEAYQVNKSSLANLRTQGYELYNQVNFPTVWNDPETFLSHPKSIVYNEYFCNSMYFSANPVDKETIFQTKSHQEAIYNIDGIGSQNGYKTGTCPSQELVDSYETDDGVSVLDLNKPYLDEVTHLVPNFNSANTIYNEQNPYVRRDPRFYATVYYNGSRRKAQWNFTETEASVENYPAVAGYRTRIIATWEGEPKTGYHSNTRMLTRTGYYERKFLHPFAGTEQYPVMGAQYKMYRLGEIILNFAEAAAEAGHQDEAVAAINEIRVRAGMPNLPAGLSKADLILRIRNERKVELALEGFRYYDVRRWATPEDDLEKTDRWITSARITRNTDGTYTYRRAPASTERLCYTNKFLWLPIPMNEVNIMKDLTGEDWQNPGW
jgi:hypothetical protein